MNQQSAKSDTKKQYEPPQLTTISLRPEEAVLGHCKIAGSSGLAGTCSFIGGCPNHGS
jgi:hypothetical protein